MQIGTITRIARYPFKGMAAESMQSAYVLYTGLFGDRTFALISPTAKKDFPWVSMRDCARLVLCKPKYKRLPSLENLFPDGNEYALDVP